jgi:hypothetical protein
MAKSKPVLPERKADEWSLVWDAYDMYRILRMNMKYYGWRLSLFQRWNMFVEIVLAVSASSTVVAMFKSGTGHGQILVPTLALLSAALSVMKPILALPKRIERCSKLWVGYATAFASLGKTIRDIQVYQCISDADERVIRDAQDQIAKLTTEDDANPNPKRVKAFRLAVNAEFPMERFWQPPASEVKDPTPGGATASVAAASETVHPA